jgi:hypothetical protein
VITRDDVRSILVSNAAMGLPAEITYETELAIDSFTLVWLQHTLEEQHGLVINPQFEDMNFFTSVNGIHAYLLKLFPGQVEPISSNIDVR